MAKSGDAFKIRVGWYDWVVLSILLLQLAAHPECQAAARAELDGVVGPGRLPFFADLPALHHDPTACSSYERGLAVGG